MSKEINIREIKDNFVKMINDDWALLTAGTLADFNTMTISWGGIGELWHKDVCFVFVRPQRYTFEFLEKNDYFSLSFFGGEYKKELGICGSQSGRDIDKMAETGFTPVDLEKVVSYEQAKVTIVLRKLAFQDMNPEGFVDETIIENHKNNDFHRVYIGEIVKVIAD